MTEYKKILNEDNTPEKIEKLISLGRLAWNSASYEEAKSILECTLKISEEINYKAGITVSYNALGSISSDSKQSLEYFFKAYFLAVKENDHKCILSSLNNIGIVFKETGMTDKSIQYLNEAVNYKLENCDSHEGIKLELIKSVALINLGVAYIVKEDYDMAIKSLLEALSISNKYNQNKLNVNYCNNLLNIALAYLKKMEAENALSYIEEAEIINNDLKNNDLETYIYYLKGLNMSVFSYFESAEKYFLKSLDTYNESFKLVSKDTIIRELIDVYIQLNDDKNIIYWQNELIDILYDINKKLFEETLSSFA